MTTTTLPTLSPMEVASTLAASLAEKRRQRLEAAASRPPFKPRRHYASSLNGCARQLVYAQINWQEKEPFSVEGQAAVEDGSHEERLLTQEILTDGFEIVEQQVQLDDDRYWVTGKIDGKIRWMGRRVPFEMKRLRSWVFDRIETVEDLRDDAFLLKYLRQLTLYLFLHNEEAGLFILSDGIGHRTYLPVPLDYQLAESILTDLDTANASLHAMARGVSASASDPLPPRIPYRSAVCGFCPFKRTCLPDMAFGEGAVMGEAELTDAVARFAVLKPSAAEYEKLKRQIAASVKDKPLIIAGDYLVTGEWKERKMAAQPERIDRWWKWDIESKAPLNGHA